MGNLANKSSSLWHSLGSFASISLCVLTLLAGVLTDTACLGWCFPPDNTLRENLDNNLAVPWQHPGTCKQSLDVQNQFTAVTSLAISNAWAHTNCHMGCMLTASEVRHPCYSER